MPSVVFSPAARAELIEARDWYAARNAELADHFITEIENGLPRRPSSFQWSTEMSAAPDAGVLADRLLAAGREAVVGAVSSMFPRGVDDALGPPRRLGEVQ